jgi:hypothetical protein
MTQQSPPLGCKPTITESHEDDEWKAEAEGLCRRKRLGGGEDLWDRVIILDGPALAFPCSICRQPEIPHP